MLKKGNVRNFINFVKRVAEIFTKHDMVVYSGYVTFYFMMSLVPLLMMVLSLINILPWFSMKDVSQFLTEMIPDIPQVRNEFIKILFNLHHQSGQLITSIFALTSLWSGSHGVFALMTGLEKINHTQSQMIRERTKAILYTVLFTFLIPSMLFFQVMRKSIQYVITYVFSLISLEAVAVHINSFLTVSGIITLAMMIFAIVLTYTFLPFGKRTVWNQLPGSVFTSILWVIFTNGFGFFIRRFWTLSSIYGTFAAVFLVAMWLKFIVTILFIGASINRALQVTVSRECST